MKSSVLSSANSDRVFAKSTKNQIGCDSDYSGHAHEGHEKLKEIVFYFLTTESRKSTGTKSQMIHITTLPPTIFIDFVRCFHGNVLSLNYASLSSV